MPFPVHPHMLRHGCGYALANAGHDTRALQAWLGHKNIQHTVRYTELAPTGSRTSGGSHNLARRRSHSFVPILVGATVMATAKLLDPHCVLRSRQWQNAGTETIAQRKRGLLMSRGSLF
jgi:Phage integrase family